MSSTYESLGNNQIKITINISSEKFQQAIEDVYNKQRGKINIQGFRKGKAPRKIIELHYGDSYFFLDAVNHVLPHLYDAAVEENSLSIVSEPEFDLRDASKENGATVVATAYIKPEVNITKEDYYGVQYPKQPLIEVSEEEIETEINKERELNTRLVSVERPIANGDVATIDFKGYVNDELFEGGSSENYKLTIGSGTFIPGFEDQLLNKSTGEEVTVNVTFPTEYNAPDLQGKDAKFIVLIKDVFEKEVPALDDEFAQDVSEFDTFEKYKQNLIERIKDKRSKEVEKEKNNIILRSLANKIEIDVPKAMIENEINTMIGNLERNIRQSGQQFEDYLAYTGESLDSLKKSIAPSAETTVRIGLILDKISLLENFEATEEEVIKEVEAIAQSFSISPEKYLSLIQKDIKNGIENDVKRQKSNKLILENAVESTEESKT